MSDLDRQSQGLGNHPALLLVDLIKGFTDPSCPLGSQVDEVVTANRILLEAFRVRQLPVVFTTVVYRDEQQARVFRDRLPALDVLTPHSAWIKVDERLEPMPGEPVIEKQWASGFFKTGLNALLHEQGVDSLVVTGLTTSGCVRATVVDGLQYNFRVVVPRQAVGDRNPEAHAANLFDLSAKYADILDLEEVMLLLKGLKITGNKSQ